MMVDLTRAQREAVKEVFDRKPITYVKDFGHYSTTMPMSYREFRRTVVQGPGCVLVLWCGMWLGIEKDGYTHS